MPSFSGLEKQSQTHAPRFPIAGHGVNRVHHCIRNVCETSYREAATDCFEGLTMVT